MTSGVRLRTNQGICLLALACATQVVAAASWDFAQLMSQLARIQSSRATYVETRHVAMLKQPLELAGTLSYSRPGRIEKIQTRPAREAVRIEGEELTVEREGRSRTFALGGSPLLGTLVESLRATLAGDGAELQRLFSVSMDGPREHWTLKLVPREIEVAGVVAEISIGGSGTRVRRVEIHEPGGDRSVMLIRESP